VDRPEFLPGAPPGSSERELLRAIRALVSADRDMRRALSDRMSLSQNDVRAVRFVMAAARTDQPCTPHEIAAHLGMTTAAATALLDRLVTAGHVRRGPHPTDRRSKVVVPTEHAYAEVEHLLAPAHDRMRAAAAAVPAEVVPAIVAFLADLTEAMSSETSRL
jgi:DNA-binding MarR family transcriptional regulator